MQQPVVAWFEPAFKSFSHRTQFIADSTNKQTTLLQTGYRHQIVSTFRQEYACQVGSPFWNPLLTASCVNELQCHCTQLICRAAHQRTLTVGISTHHSTAGLQFYWFVLSSFNTYKYYKFSYLLTSNPVTLETSRTVLLPPTYVEVSLCVLTYILYQILHKFFGALQVISKKIAVMVSLTFGNKQQNNNQIKFQLPWGI